MFLRCWIHLVLVFRLCCLEKAHMMGRKIKIRTTWTLLMALVVYGICIYYLQIWMYKSLILPHLIVILGPKWGNWIVGKECEDLLDGAVDKNPPANAGEKGPLLVWEDSICQGATKPVSHNYWARTLEPERCNYWARAPRGLKPAHLRARTLQLLRQRAATTEVCAPGAVPCNKKPLR